MSFKWLKFVTVVGVHPNLHNPTIHYKADIDSKEAITAIVSRQYNDVNGREGQRMTTGLCKSLYIHVKDENHKLRLIVAY